ncbi:MAG: ABC transporter ATP-binding protein [Caldisericia bacterium]
MIEVKNLGFAYKNAKKVAVSDLPPGVTEAFAIKRAVDDVSFDIAKGEIFGFLGPSGAGKTTTVSILIGLLKNYAGSVHVMGKDLSEIDNNYFENIGVSFELPSHYLRLTAKENLDFFSSLYKEKKVKPHEALEMVGLAADADKKVSDYSKGMKMRLNFARTLLHDPELFFFDEPTIGLDPINARRIKDIILQKKNEGKTIFLTTHNMNVADELCDRIGLIHDGNLKVVDTPHDLKLQYGKRRVQVETKAETKEFDLDGLGSNADFLKIIKADIQTIHSLEPTLEEVFIKVTGRGLL